jgi:hypothetical protein
MRRMLGVAALAVWAGYLAGCGAGSGGDLVVIAQVDTVAGVERWRYPGMEGPALRGAVDTLALIGGAMEDDDAYHFNQVTGMGLVGDAAGNLYVLDRMGTRVLKYDSRGRYLAKFGRSGNGPGELGSPAGIAIGPGESIWVADLGNWRFVIYPLDEGEARNLAFGDGPAMPGVGFTFRDGGMLHDFRQLQIMRMAMARGGSGAPPPLPQEPPRAVLRTTMDGQVLDTLWLSQPPAQDVAQSGGSNNRTVIRMQRTFEPSLYWAAFSDGGIAISDTADYALHLVDATGGVTRLINRDLPAREVTEADKEEAREKLRERMRSGGGLRVTIGGGGGSPQAAAVAAALQEEQLRSMTFAPVVPRITGLRVDPADHLWVGVSLESAGETDRIDIYDREGQLLAQLDGQPLPTTFFGSGLAARVVRDKLEVEQILIYRLPPLPTRAGEGPS